MAIGTKSNVKIYDPRTQGGYRERVAQTTEMFNAASRGCITLSSATKAGEFDIEAFFAKNAGSSVARRDPTAVTAVADQLIGQDEFAAVKLNRRIGPFALTLDSMRKAGFDVSNEGAAAFALGEWAAMDAMQDRLNIALAAIRASIAGEATLTHDISALTGGAQYLQADAFINAVQKMGDASSNIIAWVTHSAPVTKLLSGQVTGNVTGVASVVMQDGTPATLGRPLLVTDSPSLVSGSDYFVLGLTAGAVEVEDTEEEIIISELALGLENIVNRMQGEYAFNLKVKGAAWDTTAGANPTDGAVGTSANWLKKVNSVKNMGGVLIKCKAV